MRERNEYVRRTISVSPYIDEMLTKGAHREFSGNLSAFLAHIVLQYTRCQHCCINNTVNLNVKELNTKKPIVEQSISNDK